MTDLEAEVAKLLSDRGALYTGLSAAITSLIQRRVSAERERVQNVRVAAERLLEALDLADDTWYREDERAPADLAERWNALRHAMKESP